MRIASVARPIPVRGAAALAMTLAAVTIAGCGSAANPGAGLGAGPGTASAQGGQPTSSSSTAPPAGSATTPGSGTAACTSAQLSVRDRDASGTAGGHASLLIEFTNKGTRPCTVEGYPGVALQESNGDRLNAVRTKSGYMGGDEAAGDVPQVSIAPGMTVSAVVEWLTAPQNGSAVNSSNCPGYGATGLVVTVPNQTAIRVFAAPGNATPVCAGFEVHPVVPVNANSYT